MMYIYTYMYSNAHNYVCNTYGIYTVTYKHLKLDPQVEMCNIDINAFA